MTTIELYVVTELFSILETDIKLVTFRHSLQEQIQDFWKGQGRGHGERTSTTKCKYAVFL